MHLLGFSAMADARSLLRAKRQEARISHPYAVYSSSGQLRCTVCGTAVKQASMWEGHLGSKAHRVAVTKMREKAEKDAQHESEALPSKRKELDGEDEIMQTDKKRRKIGAEEAKTVEGVTNSTVGSFPADFFSDPSNAPVISAEDEDDDEATSTSLPLPKEKSQLDLEWEQFQATVLSGSVDNEKEEDRRATFERATIFAEAELAPSGTEGFPPSIVDSNGLETQEQPSEIQKEETEEEKRRRLEQDERELIMDRLIEEERVQEEADERVGLLKARVEALKRAREAKRMKKNTT